MKLKILLLLIAGFCAGMYSQTIKVTAPAEKISQPGKFYSFSRLSPDGQTIAVSGKDFNGLFLLSADGNETKKITDAAGIGWNFSWSPDGSKLAGRENKWMDRDKTSRVVVFDLEGRKVSESAFTKDVSLPFWGMQGGSVAYYEEGKGWQTVQYSSTPDAIYSITDAKVYVLVSTKSACSDLAGQNFPGQVLNIAWSPSGQRACIEVAGKGLYVYECGSNSVYDLGYGEFPCWINEEYFTYMVQKDDGYKVLSSEVYVKKYNGNDETNLTRNFRAMAMYPSCDAKGNIVFTTESGEVYKMTISIAK